MERGPLPPHERTWRHPSEVAAAERAVARTEATAPSTRVFALTTGTVGLLAVAVLILTITPARQESPIAISATTTPITSIGSIDVGAPGSTLTGLRRGAGSTLLSSGSDTATRLTESRSIDLLATPIGDGRYALVTARALSDHDNTHVDVRFPSGRVGEAEVMSGDDDSIVMVELAQSEPGREIATRRPGEHDMVTVMTSPPITIRFSDVKLLQVHEGTAVLDDGGALVALCSKHAAGGGVRLIEISERLVDATISTP